MRHLLATAASLALLTAAAAADTPVHEAKPADTAPAAYDWTGFYLGGHVGFGWGQIEDVSNPDALRRDTDGLLGGVQAGYNLQAGNIVFGVEADATLSDMHEDWGARVTHDPYYGKDRQEFFGTIRGRIGYALDHVLPYVHGGLAWSKNEHGFGCDTARAPGATGCQPEGPFYVKDTDFVVGWTVGAGVEMALIDNWSVKVEYAYTDYGKNGLRLVDPNIPADPRNNRTFETSSQTIKLGLNFRF